MLSTEASTSGPDGSKDRKKEEESEVTNSVPLYKLFAFADSTDKLLMIIGSIGAIGNGMSLPLMTVLFGELIDSFGQNQNNDVVRVVSKVLSLSLFFSCC